MTQSTLAQCKTYGIDCKETCTESNVTPAHRHRRLQAAGTGAVAVQVQRGAVSRQRLDALLECLGESGKTPKECAKR